MTDPYGTRPDYAATLAVLRIGFGTMMLLSVIRFWANGWIEKLYLEPSYFFSYRYFEWVKPPGGATYLLFALVAASALAIALGWRYRAAAIVFFLSFTYVELMDKTTYLNHYYYVSLFSFLLIFIPAAAGYSLDARRRGARAAPKWSVDALKVFVAVVYCYAGLAKLNSDWLFHAQPLAIWLPSKYDLPVLGELLQRRWVHFAFAWGGALYDLLIPFLLLYRPTRGFAFVAVVVFHVLTRVLFPIGMFPYIMIVSALVFFTPSLHVRVLRFFGARPRVQSFVDGAAKARWQRPVVYAILLVHLLLPWRYLLHDGELFWTEEGYRFSWRVMLMEKAGYLTYRIVNPTTGTARTVDPSTHLTVFQQKQLATQPDFILEFAHFLADREHARTGTRPEVYAESYVALNGRRSTPYVRPTVDLVTVTHARPRTEWLMPFNDTIYGL